MFQHYCPYSKQYGTLYPGRRFACRWAVNFCPLVRVPVKRAHIERFSACEKSVSICRADGAIYVIDKQSAWHLCLSERSVGE